MTTLSSKVLALAFASIAVASQACTLASPTEVTMVPAQQESDATEGDKGKSDKETKSTSTNSGNNAAGTCSKLSPVDVSKLTACGEGGGHCYPTSKIPGGGGSDPKRVLKCEKAGEVCVADNILEAGGKPLKECTVQALSGAAGRCLPIILPEGTEKDLAKANLKQDACDEGEVCQPCKDPTNNNADTGICGDVGVSETECSGGGDSTSTNTTPPAAKCCGGKGTCMDGSGLGGTADQMSKDTCTGDNMVCAPASLLTGKATKCESIMGGGICMDACFNDMLAMGGMILGQANCGEGESCIPCMFASMMAPDGAKVPGCE